MEASKKKLLIVELFIFAIFFTVFSILANNQYLFDWIVFNYWYYVFLLLITILSLFNNKKILSIALTIGINFGAVFANYFGNFIQNINIAKIDLTMSAQQIAQLNENLAFVYWLVIILFILVVGVILESKTNIR